jgi:hypothetical protein
MHRLFIDRVMKPDPEAILLPEKTRLTRVREGSDSLKTVVPPGVRSFLDLKPNDDLVWEILMEGKSKWIRVTKE